LWTWEQLERAGVRRVKQLKAEAANDNEIEVVNLTTKTRRTLRRKKAA
jgi:hypothetical protein